MFFFFGSMISPWSFLELNPQRQGGELNRKTAKVLQIELLAEFSKKRDSGSPQQAERNKLQAANGYQQATRSADEP